MNERIRELAERTTNSIGWCIPSEEEWWIEKFAELIVKECARVYWNIDQSEIHTEYVNDLKKHFGVE